LGGRKGICPVNKTEWWGAGTVICLNRGADLHMAQLMLLPLTVSCFSKIQIGFTFLVPAHLGSPGKGPLNGSVCVIIDQCGQNSVADLFQVCASPQDKSKLSTSSSCQPAQLLKAESVGYMLCFFFLFTYYFLIFLTTPVGTISKSTRPIFTKFSGLADQ